MSEEVKKIVENMTVEQKAGQMLVLGFSGSLPHRDVLESIEKYHPAGFRFTPHARKFEPYLNPDHPVYSRTHRNPEPSERMYNAGSREPRLTVAETAETINFVRKRSLETGAGISAYFAHDFEGNTSADTLDHTMVAFPHPMGIAAAPDATELSRKVGRVIGRQLKSSGIDMIHGPVVDVNTDPKNPEISTRSFGPDPDLVTACGLQYMLGMHESGLIGAAKHFPGRGASAVDAHYTVPVIEESAERMRSIHLKPYRALIQNGLAAIMAAHSIYPSLDPTDEISTVSKAIMTDILRGELGFEGVLLTDSFTMAGLIKKYEVVEGALRAIEAGFDLILLKDENALRGELHAGVVEAIKSGRLSEEMVNEKITRVLSMKKRFGLLDGAKGIVDIDELHKAHANPENRAVGKESAEKSLVVLRDNDNLLPVAKDKKILVVEEPFGLQGEMNNSTAYCGAIYHRLLELGADAYFTDFRNEAIDEAWPAIEYKASFCDVVVFTGYCKRGNVERRKALEKFKTLGKPLVMVANKPYEYLVPPDMGTVIVTCHTGVYGNRAAADVVFGELKSESAYKFDPTKEY